MARLLIFICLTLAIFCNIRTASSSGIEVIGSGLNNIGTSTRTILSGLTGSIKSETDALDDLPGVNQVTNLLNGLIADVSPLLQSLQSTTTNVLSGALKNVLDAVNAIKSTVLSVSPILQAIADALVSILNDVIALVDELLSIVVNLLGALSGKLNTAITGVLTQVQKLGETLVNTIGSVLSAQLINITNAVGSILSFLQSNVLSQVVGLTKEALALVVSFVSRLLQANNLISSLIQGIIAHVFVLVGQLKAALQGITKPILDTLTSTLNQVLSCVSCIGGGLLGRRRRALA